MKKMVIAFLGLAVATLIAAQDNKPLTFPVERPILSIGDTWKFQYTDLLKKEVLPGNSSLAIVAIDDKQLSFSGTGRGSNAPWRVRTNLDLNELDLHKGEEYADKQVTWPLVADKTWENPIKYASRGGEVQTEETCRVLGLEKLSVPAGQFETVKIVCKAIWRNSIGTFGTWERLKWYCPAVKNWVREEQQYWVSTRLESHIRTELLAFTVKSPH